MLHQPEVTNREWRYMSTLAWPEKTVVFQPGSLVKQPDMRNGGAPPPDWPPAWTPFFRLNMGIAQVPFQTGMMVYSWYVAGIPIRVLRVPYSLGCFPHRRVFNQNYDQPLVMGTTWYPYSWTQPHGSWTPQFHHFPWPRASSWIKPKRAKLELSQMVKMSSGKIKVNWQQKATSLKRKWHSPAPFWHCVFAMCIRIIRGIWQKLTKWSGV